MLVVANEPSRVHCPRTCNGTAVVTEDPPTTVMPKNPPGAVTICCGAPPSKNTVFDVGAKLASLVQLPAQRIVGTEFVTTVPENVTSPATSRMPTL